jgi:Protein of unknown function (DUF2934)
MNETQGHKTEELAYLLWEQQGRPENRSVENWLEAEYLAHPLGGSQPATKAESEVDLRMRGLGPLTQSEAPTPNEDGARSEEKSEQGSSRLIPLITSCIALTGLVIASGMIGSLFRKHA